ncbi:eag [Symbiodinium sp. CCMP2456]|nr:eag [Symbiodinium sp. CCMP2456]
MAPASAAAASEEGFELEFSDLIPPLSTARFLEEFWGQKVFSTSLCEDLLTILSVGFHDGNLSECVADCRKDDNVQFTEAELEGFQADLEQRRSVILPFCFTPGAIDIKRAFIHACSGFGNDIEVGMYFSRLGCEPAQWHFDPNHNLTIQILGEKDWYCAEGNPHTFGAARGMRDVPMNFMDQSIPIPGTGPLDRSCYNLRPGSVLYIPPGHWHSVTPVQGECVSVNLRVANLLHAKWICEVLFAEMIRAARGQGTLCAVRPPDFGGPGLSDTMKQQAAHCGDLESFWCRPPRCFPFQKEHSDGLRLGATLDFLKSKNFLCDRSLLSKDGLVIMSPLVSIIPKRRDADSLVVDLRSVSSLTGSDYLRFSIICSSALEGPLKLLASCGKATLCDLCDLPRLSSARQVPRRKRGQATDLLPDELASLFQVLIHGNVAFLHSSISEEALMAGTLDCINLPAPAIMKDPENVFAMEAIEPIAISRRRQSPPNLEVGTFKLYPSSTKGGNSEGKSHLHGRWMELSTQLSSVLSEMQPKRRLNAVIEGSRSLSLGVRMREHWLEKPLHPEGLFRIAWDTLALVLVTVDGFLTPVAIAWDLDTEANFVFQASFLCSFAFWFMDVFCNFNTAVYLRGNLIYARSTIAMQYLKSWLLFDILLILLDCLNLFTTSIGNLAALRVARLVRALRLVRLLKMSKLHDMIQEVAAASGRQWIMLVIAIANTACRILVVAHILACIWIWLGRWVEASQGVSWIEISGAKDLGIYVQWLHSLRYVINSPSPPSIAPNSATERVFDISAYMFSLMVIGSAISAVAGTLNDLRALNEERARQRREVRMYLTSQNAGYELIGRVMKFVDYKLEKMTAFSFDESLISPTLYTELFVGQRGKFLSKLPIFSLTLEIFPDVFAHVCTTLQKHVFEKGELVFAAGDWAESLHMTTAGIYTLSDISLEEPDDRILKGEEVHWFAEVSLYAETAIHISTLRAKNIAEMFMLSGDSLVSTVRESPACSALFCEYARDFIAKQRGVSDTHDDHVRYARDCCQKSQYFQELHPDQSKQFENVDILTATSAEFVEAAAGPSSPLQEAEPARFGVASLIVELTDGTLGAEGLSQKLQRLLPEIHPTRGTYRVFEEGAERGRAESACIGILALLANRYDIYTYVQSANKLSQLQWEQLQEIVRWIHPTEKHVRAVLVLLAMRGLGKSKAVLSQVPEQDQRPERAVLYLMEEQKNVVPSVAKLDDDDVALVQDTLLHHETFKLAQMLQGENVPASLAELQERFSESGNGAFQFYVLFLLGFMSGIAGGLGSKFMTAKNADAVISCICMLQRLLEATPLGIYWGYLSARAGSLGLPCTTTEDLALVRLACLSRLQDRDGYVALRRAWCTCSQRARMRLMSHFLADGMSDRAFVLEFLPDCISNAKGNKLVGLSAFLLVLVDLLANLAIVVDSSPNMNSRKLVNVDLSDMSAFTLAVQNCFVFRTCVSRCNFQIREETVQVQMTSENWSRTQDPETDTTNMCHMVTEILLQQQAVMGHFSIEQASSWPPRLSASLDTECTMEDPTITSSIVWCEVGYEREPEHKMNSASQAGTQGANFEAEVEVRDALSVTAFSRSVPKTWGSQLLSDGGEGLLGEYGRHDAPGEFGKKERNDPGTCCWMSGACNVATVLRRPFPGSGRDANNGAGEASEAEPNYNGDHRAATTASPPPPQHPSLLTGRRRLHLHHNHPHHSWFVRIISEPTASSKQISSCGSYNHGSRAAEAVHSCSSDLRVEAVVLDWLGDRVWNVADIWLTAPTGKPLLGCELHFLEVNCLVVAYAWPLQSRVLDMGDTAEFLDVGDAASFDQLEGGVASEGSAGADVAQLLREQLAISDVCLLNKCDLVDSAQRDQVSSRIREVNPAVRVVPCRHGKVNLAQVLQVNSFSLDGAISLDAHFLTSDADHGDGHGEGHDHGHGREEHPHAHSAMSSLGLEIAEAIERSALEDWLRSVVERLGQDLIRLKGVLRQHGEASCLVVQGVGGHIDVSDASDLQPATSRLVIIGRVSDWGLRKELQDGFLALGAASAKQGPGSRAFQPPDRYAARVWGFWAFH